MNIYLDNAATTRVLPEVRDAMLPFLSDDFGNPSSKHYDLGRRARRAVMAARQQIAALLKAEVPADEDRVRGVYFTACATESNNWVLQNAPLANKGKKHLIVSAVEHPAVLTTAAFMEKHYGYRVTVVPVDATGLVDPAAVEKALSPDTALVSVMVANNEVGTLEPVAEIAKIAHQGGALMHTDAVQAAGKIPLDVNALGVDFLSISGHKFHGPKGVGALYVAPGINLPPLIHGGGQENNHRAGTYNVAGIVGMGKAAEIAMAEMAESAPRQFALVERLWQGLSAASPKIYRNGHPEKRIPNVLNVRYDGAEGEAVLLRLDMFGIQVSSGSACATGDIKASHVLLALGIPQENAHGSIRFSLGRDTTAEDIEKVIEIVPKQVQTIRDMSVTWKG